MSKYKCSCGGVFTDPAAMQAHLIGHAREAQT